MSKIKDETLSNRIAEVPKAKAIIKDHLNEFLEWHDMRKNVPVLKSIKNKLYAMQSCDMYINYAARQNNTTVVKVNKAFKIQKVINGMALKMRSQNQCGCNYIEAINEFIATGTN